MLTGILLAAAIVAAPFLGAALIAALRAAGKEQAPYAALGLITSAITAALAGWFWLTVPRPLTWRFEWIPAAGIGFGFHIDELSLLFALLVAGVGMLTFLYSVPYLAREREGRGASSGPAAYYGYLLLFTGGMLGLVFSADLIQLYLFWELIDIASFLLIGLNWRDSDARYSAVKVLLVTTFGGLAVLLGFVLIGAAAGTYAIPELLERGDLLRASPLFLPALVLLVIGAATKSAQFPLHVWLPNAMRAPTPVNAFVDSAALLAAGVYLLARMHPLFAEAPLWGWAVGGVGMASMLVGGVLALRATDLKFILAYSTVSQYGFIFALLGYAGAGALAAALFFFLQHGLLKAGLFFVVGAVIYASGSAELGKGEGLWRRLPLAFALAVVLALSLGGVPPLAGFWMKESFVKETLGTEAAGLIALAVVGGALTLAYMLRWVAGTFVRGAPVRAPLVAPPRMLLVAPGVLALLTVLFGLWPDLAARTLAEPAAAAVLGQLPELALEIELEPALFLSLLVLALGALAFATFGRWEVLVQTLTRPEWSLDRLYRGLASAGFGLGRSVSRLQNGHLTRYLAVMLLGLAALIVLAALLSPPLPQGAAVPDRPEAAAGWIFDWRMSLLLLLVSASALLTLVVRVHLHLVLALGAVGYLIAAVFALALAPNVGLLQVHVETLVTVLLVVALARSPRPVRERLVHGTARRFTSGRVGLAAAAGLASAWVSWLAIAHLPAEPIAPWFNENAQRLTDAEDVVTAVLVHFRALDTLGEIIVFATAAAGVYALANLIRGETR